MLIQLIGDKDNRIRGFEVIIAVAGQASRYRDHVYSVPAKVLNYLDEQGIKYQSYDIKVVK